MHLHRNLYFPSKTRTFYVVMGANNVFSEIESFDKGLISKNKAFKRLKQQSVGTGVFGSKAFLVIPSDFVPGGHAIEK